MKLTKVFVVRVYRMGPAGVAEGIVETSSGRRRRRFSSARELWQAISETRPPRSRRR